MQFDVVIGNPPYQDSDGGGGSGRSASPLYHLIIMRMMGLNVRYISMIIPTRWYAHDDNNLKYFRKLMLNHTRILVDYKSRYVFNAVNISGGVCYWLWDRHYTGDCEFICMDSNTRAIRELVDSRSGIVIRDNIGLNILNKVRELNELTFDSIVSARVPFGIESNYPRNSEGDIKVYCYESGGRSMFYIPRYKITRHEEYIDKYKILLPKAFNNRLNPILAEPLSIGTETYLLVKLYADKDTLENVISYINTKFFHYLLHLRKNTHNAPRSVYEFIPLQDFRKKWTDEELYKKYGLTQYEIYKIESSIK